MKSNFVPYDRETDYLLPPSLNDWLPANHLARFVAEIVSQPDLTALKKVYTGRGSTAYHPEMLLTGVKPGGSCHTLPTAGNTITPRWKPVFQDRPHCPLMRMWLKK